MGSYEYASGAAHGNGGTTYLNLDTVTGRPIQLSDFLTGDYKGRINPMVLADLRQQNPEEELTFEGVTENFLISPEGLLFSFVPYEIACYAAGQLESKVSWSQINDLVRPEGPVQLPL